MPFTIQDILDIPDIQDGIADAMSERDLMALPLVNKQWNATFTRYLWRDLTKRMPVYNDSLTRHGHHVRHLCLCQQFQVMSCLQHCHHLVSLEIKIRETSDDNRFTNVLDLIQVNRNTLLQLTLWNFGMCHSPWPIVHMSHLTKLHLLYSKVPCQVIAMFLDHCPSLRTLEIGGFDITHLVPEAFKHDEYPCLEKLTIDSVERERYWDLTLFLWERCPSLDEFNIAFDAESRKPSTFQRILDTLKTHPSKNRILDITDSPVCPLRRLSEEIVATLVQACPVDTISKLLFDKITMTSTLWTPLFHHQSNSLTLLDLSACNVALPRGSVQRVLCSCRMLKYFDAIPVRLPSDVDPEDVGMLAAMDVALATWVCLSIELLRFVLVGICAKHPDKCRCHDQCERIKHGVLEQLGQLSKLHTLGIAHQAIGNSSISDNEVDQAQYQLENEGEDKQETMLLEWPIGCLDERRFEGLRLVEIRGPNDRQVKATLKRE